MKDPHLIPVCCVVLMGFAVAAAAAQANTFVELTKVADSGTPVPGSTASFDRFGNAATDGDTVAFDGQTTVLSEGGVFDQKLLQYRLLKYLQ